MTRMLLALCLSCWAAPLAAQGTAAPYDRAVAARVAGDDIAAVALLEPVVAADPGNADAQLQLGLALLALNRLDAAETAFERVLAIAPDYADARIGLARVHQRRGDTARARSTLAPVPAGNAEARVLRRQLAARGAEEWRWRLDVDASLSDLTRGQRDWREASARVAHRPSPGTVVAAAVEVADRFGLTDTYGELRLDRRLSDAATLHVFAGATPDADFRPRWQIGAGGSLKVRGGGDATVLTINAAQARYRSGDIQTLTPGIDQYFAGGRAWLGLRWINLFDEDGDHQGGWLARGDVLATDRLRLFVGAADAPDTSEGVAIDVFSLFGGLAYDVSDAITARLTVAHEDRDRRFDRLQVGLGLGWKF